jgi:hypothetical protein
MVKIALTVGSCFDELMRGRLHITRLRVLMLITKKNANPEERGNTLRGSRSTMTSLATSVRFWMCL